MNTINLILVDDINKGKRINANNKEMLANELPEGSYFFEINTIVNKGNPLYDGKRDKAILSSMGIKHSKEKIIDMILDYHERGIYEKGDCFVSLRNGGRV